MHRELVDEQRIHVALLEVARVDPVGAAGDLVAALRVRDEIAVDLEQQLLDALFLEHLLEPPPRPGPLVLDRLGVDVAEADLEEVPHGADVASAHVADVDQRPGQLFLLAPGALGRVGLTRLAWAAAPGHRGKQTVKRAPRARRMAKNYGTFGT